MDEQKTYLSGQAITNYIREVGINEPDVLRRLRKETASHPQAIMQITPEQGQFFHVLLRSINAKKTLEVGVFTGYSSTLAAMALPADGRVVACDVSEEFTSTAKRYWKEAGVEQKVELRLRPAVETLQGLLEEGAAATFDFAFLDAEKTEYDAYYELTLKLVRRGGLIALDNMLRHGQVLEPSNEDAGTAAIRKLNEKIHNDSRVIAVLLPIADGVTLATKL